MRESPSLLSALTSIPPRALLVAVPVIVFLVAAVIGASSASSDEPTTEPETLSLQVTVSQAEALPTPLAEAEPEIVEAPNRQDCAAIEGTDYLSPEERDWYLENCTGGGSSGGGSGGGSLGASTVSGPPPAVGAGQAPLGDRLVIPAIGVNADVWAVKVGADGQMADPTGYFNVLWYDFSAFAGLGGGPAGGNLVLAGHVDCARCHNGSPGLAVLYYAKNLKGGDQIDYYTAGGQLVHYVVTSAGDYAPNSNWSSIVAAGAADLTIITCTGTWDPSAHEYSHRRVVFARKA